jgi:sugar lactone lactonase YvrE
VRFIQTFESDRPRLLATTSSLVVCICVGLFGCKSQTQTEVSPAEVFPVPTITTQNFLLASGTGTAVVQNPDAGFTYQWTVLGGEVAGARTGNSIAYRATGASPITVSCSAVNAAGHAGPAGSAAVNVAEYGLQLLAGSASGGGSVDGTGGAARFFFNKHAAGNFAAGGPVYVADWQNCLLRKLVKTDAGWVVTTLAGVERDCSDIDGKGQAARLNGGGAIAVDSHGNIFLGTYGAVRKVTPDGTVSFFAGQYNAQPSFADGTGSSARFSNTLEAMTIDAKDNLYLIDSNAIRKITPGAVVTTLAGSQAVSGHQDGAGTSATFDYPGGIAVDANGNLFVAEESNSLIRKIDPSGSVTTYAGTLGVKGGADGPLASAEFAWVRGLAMAADGGALLAVDCNGIRSVSSSAVTTVFEDTPAADDGNTACATDLMVGADGDLLLVEGYNYWLRNVSSTGVMSLVAGSAPLRKLVDGPGIASRLLEPSALAVDPGSGVIYVASRGDSGIRKFDPESGVLSTFLADVGDGQPALRSLALDAAKNLYVAVGETHTIRKITPSGAVRVLSTSFVSPGGIAVDAAGNVFVADSGNGTLWKLAPGGNPTLITGVPDGAPPVDGPRGTARLFNPSGLAADSAGTLYFCDRNSVRSATQDGTVTTIAGSFDLQGHGDGVGSAASFGFLSQPCGIALDGDGNLLIADWGNSTIRKVAHSGSTWTVSTLLGTSQAAEVAPGPISAALLSRPQAVGVLPNGDIVVGDWASASLLVMRACGGASACSCSVDTDCGRGYTCANSMCKAKWALALGDGASLAVPSTPDLFPGNDFTLEMWLKLDSSGGGDIWNKWTDSQEDKHLYRFSDVSFGYIAFTGVTTPYLLTQFTENIPEQWHHLAVSNDGTTERVFEDGVLVGSTPSGTSSVSDSAGTLYFGRNFDRGDSVANPYTVADIRLSSGQRYTGNFVPDTQFANDAMTRALWHLDAGTGTTVADSSGNGHPATLIGPYGWVADDR